MRTHFKSSFQSLPSGSIYLIHLDDRKLNDGKTYIHNLEKDLLYYFKGVKIAFRLYD